MDITEQKKAVETLRESEEKYRAVIETTDTGFVALDEHGRVLDANLNYAHLIGHTCVDEILGRQVIEWTAPYDIERNRMEIGKCFEKGSVKNLEIDYKRTDGTIVPIEINANVVQTKNGKIIVTLCRNITERKRAEEALQESEARFRALSSMTSEGIMIHEGGVILDANQTFAELVGYSNPDTLIGKNGLEITPFTPESRQRVLANSRAGSTSTYEVELVKPDGSVLPAETQGKEITYRGRLARLIFMRDITERKRAARALRESEERYRRINSCVPDLIWTTDLSGKITYVSPAVERLYGWTVEECLNLPPAPLSTPQQRAKDVAILKEELEKAKLPQYDRNTIHTFEAEELRKDGSTFLAEVSATLLWSDDGKPTGVIGMTRDITERKQAEQKIFEYQKRLKQLASQLTLIEEQERRQIAGEIHDEISQTLAMAKIKLDALRSSPPSEWSPAEIKQISSFIEKVIQETRTLTFELSNPILYELGFEAAAAEWLNEQVRVKYGIDTDFFDDGKAKPLNDDLKVMLFRNVRELLTNCIKHAKAEKISVSIRRIDDSIQVIVEDNGAGFDPARLRTTAGKKLTFGLFSIRESMENTGGSFEIESKPGAGCKAVMTAPLKSSVINKEI